MNNVNFNDITPPIYVEYFGHWLQKTVVEEGQRIVGPEKVFEAGWQACIEHLRRNN